MLDPHDPGVWKNKPFKKGVYARQSNVRSTVSLMSYCNTLSVKFCNKCYSWLVLDTVCLTSICRVSGSWPVWSLHCCVISLDKKLFSTLSLFTQVYKWIPATYCWGAGVNPVMDLLSIQMSVVP